MQLQLAAGDGLKHGKQMRLLPHQGRLFLSRARSGGSHEHDVAVDVVTQPLHARIRGPSTNTPACFRFFQLQNLQGVSGRSYTYRETTMGRARMVMVGRKSNEKFSRVEDDRVGVGGVTEDSVPQTKYTLVFLSLPAIAYEAPAECSRAALTCRPAPCTTIENHCTRVHVTNMQSVSHVTPTFDRKYVWQADAGHSHLPKPLAAELRRCLPTCCKSQARQEWPETRFRYDDEQQD